MPKLVASLTEPSNDAFVEASIVTGLSTLSRQAWVVDLIQIETTIRVPNTDAANCKISITRGSKTAVPTVDDRDVIFKVFRVNSFTTSGATHQDLVFHFAPPSELLIVEDTIYAQLDSDSFGAQLGAKLSIEVHAKTITESQRLAILAGRIS